MIERDLDEYALKLERLARKVRERAEVFRAEREAGREMSADALLKTLRIASKPLRWNAKVAVFDPLAEAAAIVRHVRDRL